MTNFSKVLVDCSAIGQIMSDGHRKTAKQNWETACNELSVHQQAYDNLEDRRKSMSGGIKLAAKIEGKKKEISELELHKDDECLSDGAKSYLNDLYAAMKYHKSRLSKDIGNKYSSKGRQIEDIAIDLICELDSKKLKKNKELISNSFLRGIPDLIEESPFDIADYVIDVKSPWDISSFFDNLGKPLNRLYWWQIQGYMALTGAFLGEVSYCLVNTPDALIKNETDRLLRNMRPETNEQYAEFEKLRAQIVNNLTFDEIPAPQRRLKFVVERDQDAIDRIYKKVEACREYLYEIEKIHLNG